MAKNFMYFIFEIFQFFFFYMKKDIHWMKSIGCILMSIFSKKKKKILNIN